MRVQSLHTEETPVTTMRLAIAPVFALLCSLAAANSFAQSAAPPGAAAAFAEAVQLQDAGKFGEAIPLLKRAIDAGYQPVNPARFRLARAYARAGSADLALAELDTLVAGGFANVPALAATDLDSLRALPRFKAIESRVNALAHPCAADARFHAFDFWIGEWDVQPTGPTRGPMGSGSTSVIEAQLDGCVVQENWMPIGGVGAGKSFNIFNTASSKWEQYWVDSRGTITHFTGAFRDDGNLYYEANQFASTNKVRMTFFNQGPNQVRQLGQVSTDDGKTWTVTYDLTYVRKPGK